MAWMASLAACALLAQSTTGLTREQMAADLEQLAGTIEKEWAYAEDRKRSFGIDVEALAAEAIGKLEGVSDDAQFVGLVREVVARLHDGHAYVAWDGEENQPFRRWPFTFTDTADGLVITSVVETWNRTPAAFERGDVLLEVDGVPVAERIARAEKRTNASTDGARRRWALARTPLNETDPSRYKVLRADGSECVIEAYAAARMPEPAPQSNAVEHRRLAEGVAYLCVPSFAFADSEAWAAASPSERPKLLERDRDALRAAIAAAEGCKALVLDLRGNGGGTDLLGMELAACLLGGEPVYYGLASTNLLGGWSSPSFYSARPEGSPPRFAGQLVVLIDEDTFSTCDNLCRCLDDLHPDVTFVGRPTGGGTGAPRPAVTLEHSGITVGFCTMRVVGPKGELIDGRGTVPDVLVRPTRESVLAGRDLDLEAALKAVR
jgi:C-terminal processing protease CtpA/Prc